MFGGERKIYLSEMRVEDVNGKTIVMFVSPTTEWTKNKKVCPN